MQSLLDQIKEKLDELAAMSICPMEAVEYGLLPPGSEITKYNYLVFGRANIGKSGTSKNDFSEYYVVSIVHENYIPDGYIYEVIKKIKEIKGMKLADQDITFDYARKSGTDMTVEVASIMFVKARNGSEMICRG